MRTALLIVLAAASCADSSARAGESDRDADDRPRLPTPRWRDEHGAIERGHLAAAGAGPIAHRAQVRARARVVADDAWCRRLPAAELDHTPFDHRGDVIAVSAELDGDRLHGARIRFGAVPGLTAAWLHLTLGCHRDIAAALGYPAAYMPASPAVIANTTATVLDDQAGAVVVLWTVDPEAAVLIYMRAEALLDDHLVHDHSDHEH